MERFSAVQQAYSLKITACGSNPARKDHPFSPWGPISPTATLWHAEPEAQSQPSGLCSAHTQPQEQSGMEAAVGEPEGAQPAGADCTWRSRSYHYCFYRTCYLLQRGVRQFSYKGIAAWGWGEMFLFRNLLEPGLWCSMPYKRGVFFSWINYCCFKG